MKTAPKTTYIKLPFDWSAYLINPNNSNLDPAERTECESATMGLGYCYGVFDDDHIGRYNGKGRRVSTYVFHNF